MSKVYRTRIAPTTSGLLHIGHASTFKCACERAKKFGGSVVLRIDDIDFERCKKEYLDAAIEDMQSCGIEWDEGYLVGGKFGPYLQSQRLATYESVMLKLISCGAIYPSPHSRAEIARIARYSSSKNNLYEPELIFPTEFRTETTSTDIANFKNLNWRFRIPDGELIDFFDNHFGHICFEASVDFGDFLVWRKNGTPSYELASAIDDACMQITEIVRGADLLLSTARQILIWRTLGSKIPEFYHCPLLRGDNGEKLSKTSMQKSGENRWLIRTNRENI